MLTHTHTHTHAHTHTKGRAKEACMQRPSQQAIACTLHPLPSDKMYWSDGGTDKIQRASLDGSSVEDLVSGLQISKGIALDVAAGR